MDLFKGYTREPEMTQRLTEAIRAALYASPTERLGQLLMNLARRDDLWNIKDEEWIELLEADRG